MENPSNISWALVGVKPKGEKISEEDMEKMLLEAFLPEKKFIPFICGAAVESRTGTLEEMENGYNLLKIGSEDYEYQEGDFCIISEQSEGSLLFVPVEIEENVKDVSGNTSDTQEESSSSS